MRGRAPVWPSLSTCASRLMVALTCAMSMGVRIRSADEANAIVGVPGGGIGQGG